MILFLAGRTIERAAVSDRHALDKTRTSPARLAIAIINSQVTLEFAGFIVGISIVGKRCATPPDRVAQQAGNGLRELLNLLAR